MKRGNRTKSFKQGFGAAFGKARESSLFKLEEPVSGIKWRVDNVTVEEVKKFLVTSQSEANCLKVLGGIFSRPVVLEIAGPYHLELRPDDDFLLLTPSEHFSTGHGLIRLAERLCLVSFYEKEILPDNKYAEVQRDMEMMNQSVPILQFFLQMEFNMVIGKKLIEVKLERVLKEPITDLLLELLEPVKVLEHKKDKEMLDDMIRKLKNKLKNNKILNESSNSVEDLARELIVAYGGARRISHNGHVFSEKEIDFHSLRIIDKDIAEIVYQMGVLNY